MTNNNQSKENNNQNNTNNNPATEETKPINAEKNSNQINNFKEEIDSLKDKNLRLLAELDNIRRRSKEDIEKTSKYAIANFAADLVPTIENFFLASSNVPKDEIEKSNNLKNYHQAIDMTHKELLKILQKNNITRIYPINEKFNHNLHEAISRIESDKEEGIVVQVIQAGYQIGDRLIKPALVSVSKKAS